jgi:hypothetical protein
VPDTDCQHIGLLFRRKGGKGTERRGGGKPGGGGRSDPDLRRGNGSSDGPERKPVEAKPEEGSLEPPVTAEAEPAFNATQIGQFLSKSAPPLAHRSLGLLNCASY